MNIFPNDQLPKKPRILLIKLRSIGDVIYNTSVYSPIKRAWPSASLTVIVEPPAYDIVRYHPDVDEVLVFRKGSLLGQIAFYLKLRRNRYDVAIDMHEGPRGATMCLLSGAKFRVGNALSKRAFFYNVRLNFSEYAPKLPIDYQAGLIQRMGVPVENPRPLVIIAENSRERGRKLLEQNDVKWDGLFCVIHPGARIYDQWQYEKFAQLADQLHDSFGLKIVLTCGPGQAGQMEEVKKRIQSADYAFIETGLQELGAITERSRFVICHNGGYMHLAAAVGTPVIALFGHSNPAIWKPLGEGHYIIQHQLACFPCSLKTMHSVCKSGKPECKETITVEEVLQAASRIMNDHAGP